MRSDLRLCRLFVFGWLLIFGSVAMAQETRNRAAHPAAARGNAHADEHGNAKDPLLNWQPPESFLSWLMRSLGMIGWLIPIVGLLTFALTIVVVIRGQGPYAVAALVFLVPMPLLLGLFGTLEGSILSLQVIATSTVEPPKASEICDGIAIALFNPLLGLLAMTPGYLVATLGSIFRSFARPSVRSDG